MERVELRMHLISKSVVFLGHQDYKYKYCNKKKFISLCFLKKAHCHSANFRFQKT